MQSPRGARLRSGANYVGGQAEGMVFVFESAMCTSIPITGARGSTSGAGHRVASAAPASSTSSGGRSAAAWSPPEPIVHALRSKYECKDEESYSNGKYLSVSWLYELEGEEAVGYL